DEIEKLAQAYIDTIDAMGGSVEAIEQGYMQNEIAQSAYKYQKDIENKDKIIVGVNKYSSDEINSTPIFKIDDSIRLIQIEKINALKKERNNQLVEQCLNELSEAAKGTSNLMPPIIRCVEAYATLGEIADVLRNVFGEYKG